MKSGLRAKGSCATALIDVSEEIRFGIDWNKVSFLIILDHSKAFDTVYHRIFLTKLSKMYNFSSSAVKLIFTDLTERPQGVCFNDLISDFLSLLRGVPQGSVLGPLLFSSYVNDLPCALSNCGIHMYAG